ncbi:hypothetical protein [Leptolyngbya sp. FACHB-17]|uniref:hypothetical protein n=1 Tax=unclassified Leptolyngbya TaxID=2650499 RepID=UPI001680265B|nr:hypothetical protein [Leptolyngbya sp. FACHB-17]MBD2078347.1 hypothetical protein [Leptolyngbya sp. FACHB-17]
MTEADQRPEGQGIPSISGEMLNQIMNAVSFSGDHEIARLAIVIKNVRSFKAGLAASNLALRHASGEYDQALCLSLYQALRQVNAIDSDNGIRVSTLQRLWRYKQIPLLELETKFGER